MSAPRSGSIGALAGAPADAFPLAAAEVLSGGAEEAVTEPPSAAQRTRAPSPTVSKLRFAALRAPLRGTVGLVFLPPGTGPGPRGAIRAASTTVFRHSRARHSEDFRDS